MSRTFKRFWPMLVAGLFMTAPSIFVHGQGPNQTKSASKKIKGAHRQEVQAQRQRLKHTRKEIRAEALQSGHHAAPPKPVRHRVIKAQRNPSLQSSNLKGARKHSRKRK